MKTVRENIKQWADQEGSMNLGCRVVGDRTLPLRLVANAQTGGIVVRCVGMTDDGRGCVDEWDAPEDISGVPSIPLGAVIEHMRIVHRRR